MKSSFLSLDNFFDNKLHIFDITGNASPANDLCLLTSPDDGFVHENGKINIFLKEGKTLDRFGRFSPCELCAVRPAVELGLGEERRLKHRKESGSVITVEFGAYPSYIADTSLRELAKKQYETGVIAKTDGFYTIAGEKYPVYQVSGRQLIKVTYSADSAEGYILLSDGTAVTMGEEVFLEVKPVRWFYLEESNTLVCGSALFAGLDYDAAEEYLENVFLYELTQTINIESVKDADFRIEKHDELSVIRALVDANVPVFIHGLSGDGKSDRVKQIDPDVLDIELVNETPETINGRAIYNESKDEIIDIKPTWLVKLEKLCADGKPHILFFDELTNATKQTQSVIFKIVLDRFVNNRWPLPKNARIVAAGNDRSESTAAHDLAEPLFGRFAHVYIRTTIENWMPWAIGKKINPFVLEFLANNDLNLRTAYTGKEANADPRRWEMASRVLDSSNNDLSLLDPIIGRETAEAFRRFFVARRDMDTILNYTDEEIARFGVAKRYQTAQQCLCIAPFHPTEARELVSRLGEEYLAWYNYMTERKRILYK